MKKMATNYINEIKDTFEEMTSLYNDEIEGALSALRKMQRLSESIEETMEELETYLNEFESNDNVSVDEFDKELDIFHDSEVETLASYNRQLKKEIKEAYATIKEIGYWLA